MTPGASIRPVASTWRVAASPASTGTITPLRTPTSAMRPSSPLPSRTVAPEVIRPSIGCLLRRERVAEQAGGVAVGHGPDVGIGQAGQPGGEQLLGVRPGRVGVRVVDLDHDV